MTPANPSSPSQSQSNDENQFLPNIEELTENSSPPTAEGAGDQFDLFGEDVAEIVDGASASRGEDYFTRKLTANPTKTQVFLLLERLSKLMIHQAWEAGGPQYYLCEPSCLICKTGEKANPYLTGRVYVPDDDLGSTLLMPLFDQGNRKGLNAVRELKALTGQLGEKIMRTPLELTEDTSSSGIKHIVLTADRLPDGTIFSYSATDPDFLAAQAMRDGLTEKPTLRPFSLELDEALAPKMAKKVRRKCHLSREI
jgi:hypothetical protein